MDAYAPLKRIASGKRGQSQFHRWVKRTQDEALGEKLLLCRTYLELRHYLVPDELKCNQTFSCREPTICTPCASDKGVKMGAAYGPRVELLMEADSSLRAAMLTYTVKNGRDLRETYEKLRYGRKRLAAAMRRARSSSSRNNEMEFSKVLGGIRSLEVTNHGRGWHPHEHDYSLIRGNLDWEKIGWEWSKAVGEKSLVNERRCDNGVANGLKEVLKYIVDFDDEALTWSQRMEVYRMVKGNIKTVSSWGILRGVKVQDADSDDLSEMSGPYVEIIARWLFKEGRFGFEFEEEHKRLEYTIKKAS